MTKPFPAPNLTGVVSRLKAVLGEGGWSQDPDVIAPLLVEWRGRWQGGGRRGRAPQARRGGDKAAWAGEVGLPPPLPPRRAALRPAHAPSLAPVGPCAHASRASG